MPKNILIKGSGDVVDKEEFLSFVRERAQNNYVVVICGGGTQVSDALKRAGYEIHYNEHGRVTQSWEERKIARDVLELEEKGLQDKLIGTGAHVIAPVLKAGSVLCHINADNLVKAYYLGFEEIYVFTLNDRLAAKQKVFAQHPKVQVMGI